MRSPRAPSTWPPGPSANSNLVRPVSRSPLAPGGSVPCRPPFTGLLTNHTRAPGPLPFPHPLSLSSFLALSRPLPYTRWHFCRPGHPQAKLDQNKNLEEMPLESTKPIIQMRKQRPTERSGSPKATQPDPRSQVRLVPLQGSGAGVWGSPGWLFISTQ